MWPLRFIVAAVAGFAAAQAAASCHDTDQFHQADGIYGPVSGCLPSADPADPARPDPGVSHPGTGGTPSREGTADQGAVSHPNEDPARVSHPGAEAEADDHRHELAAHDHAHDHDGYAPAGHGHEAELPPHDHDFQRARADWAAMAAAAGSIPWTADRLSVGMAATTIGGADALAVGASRRDGRWRFSVVVMGSGPEVGATVGAAFGLAR